MMRYRNKKSGQIIKTTGVVSGQNWELVKDDSVQNYEDKTFEDDATDTEPDAEETPAEKPKATRRGEK